MPLPSSLNNYKTLAERFKKAKDRKTTSWWSHMRECYEYAAPQRETFESYSPGQKKNVDIFDDTAVTGVQIFANRMQRAIVPPWQKWGLLTPGSEIPPGASVNFQGQDMPLQDALDNLTTLIFTYIHRSNFSSRIYEAFIDLAMSTGTITCEYDAKKDELVFNSVPLSQLYISPGPRGEIDDHWREHEIECGMIYQLWPKATLDDTTKRATRERPAEKISVVEGCVYHEDLYYYVVLLNNSKQIIYSQDEGTVGPFISFRGMVVPGEGYGRGPVMQVLPSIKTLNVVKEFELTAAAISASGAWTGRDDGVFNPYTVRIAPGVVIPVGSNDRSNPTLSALPLSFDINLTQIVAKDLREEINKALFAEPLGGMDDPTKTATEIQMRYQMHLESSGAYFARLQTELVEKLIKRVIFVLQREGRIPPIMVDGKQVTLKHTSPISRVMDQEDLNNLQLAAQGVAAFGNEALMLTFDFEKVGEYIAEKHGVNPSLYRDETERAMLKKQIAQVAQQMQAQQQGDAQAAAAAQQQGGM